MFTTRDIEITENGIDEIKQGRAFNHIFFEEIESADIKKDISFSSWLFPFCAGIIALAVSLFLIIPQIRHFNLKLFLQNERIIVASLFFITPWIIAIFSGILIINSFKKTWNLTVVIKGETRRFCIEVLNHNNQLEKCKKLFSEKMDGFNQSKP